ncbi:MAG: MFS transporter [Usitatibacteraceae bacterium]
MSELSPRASQHRHPPPSLAWTMWGLGAALYFIGFYQRVAPAVITVELSQAFGLTAAALGNLSAFYFYSYVALQIPTGLLADRFGPRVLLTIGAAIAGIGTAVFAIAPDTWTANLGRLLIGGSVGVAFVSMLKLASHWMPARQFALASALALVVGVFGAVSAGAPLRLLVDEFGWRAMMWASAALTIMLGVLTWVTVRDDPEARGYKSYADHTAQSASVDLAPHKGVFAGLLEAFRERNVFLLFFIAGAPSSIILTFAGLWGVPFLTTHYALSAANAAGLCSAMMVTWAIGCLVYGAASDRIGRRKPLMIGGMFVVLVLWATFIYVPALPYFWLVTLLLSIGFFSGCFILSFVFAKESCTVRLSGTVSGIANMGVIQGPMYMQPLVGIILDRTWSGSAVGGKRIFDLASYQQGFSSMLIWGVLAIVLLFFTRETWCKQRN